MSFVEHNLYFVKQFKLPCTYTDIILSMFLQGNASDKIEHYGKFTILRDAYLPRKFYITNMSTLVSNSKYYFQVLIHSSV